ncbi:MAG: hypothetical protein WCK60_01085 [Candidatus Nomurabacteria bacterium]
MAETLIWLFRWVFWLLTFIKENFVEESDDSSEYTFVNGIAFAFGLSSLISPVFIYPSPSFKGIKAIHVFLPGIIFYLIIGLWLYFFEGKFFSRENKSKRWQYRGSW